MRRRGSAAALLLACATALAAPHRATADASCSPRAAPDPAVPSWEAVNGFALGSRPATPAELDRFLLAVDAASARVVVRQAGASAAGRPVRYAIVAEPEALGPRSLAALRGRLAAIVAGRASSAGLGGRAVVWLAGSVHGDEPSGADADARLLGELAAGRDCATLRRLHELVVAIMPVQNPDGRLAGTRVSATGFDLNRDWLAATQPETAATLRAVRALPPLVFVDQHEQAGATAFVPPYVEPVHHEVPAAARRAVADTFGPALRAAVASVGSDPTKGPRLDLLYPGYADSAATLLFGAAGMTVEAPGGSPFAERVGLHAAAGRAVLDTAARHRAALLRAWAASARAAVAQGIHGRAQGRRAASGRAFGFAVRADRRAADAAALVAILLRAGVRVERLGAPARAPALRAWTGGRARAATLPAGTYVVPAGQGAKHWLRAVLERDARPARGAVSDVSAWSLPLLMGLDGGALQAPLPRAAVRRAVVAPPSGGAPQRAAAASAFPGDATDSAGLALALLEGGAVVRRLAGTGRFVAQGVAPATLAAAARAHRTTVRATGAGAAGRGVALRRPRVALVGADAPAPPTPSAGWARQALQTTLGLHPEVVTPTASAAAPTSAGAPAAWRSRRSRASHPRSARHRRPACGWRVPPSPSTSRRRRHWRAPAGASSSWTTTTRCCGRTPAWPAVWRRARRCSSWARPRGSRPRRAHPRSWTSARAPGAPCCSRSTRRSAASPPARCACWPRRCSSRPEDVQGRSRATAPLVARTPKPAARSANGWRVPGATSRSGSSRRYQSMVATSVSS